MSFKPNTTVYLCSGTGLDMANSIWWHRFAYPKSTLPKDDTWWNTCFQWVKAHSVAQGYWYMSNIHQGNGYIDVGRTPYQTAMQWGEEGLGNSAKQSELDNPYIYYTDALTAVDYLAFSNGVQEAPQFTSDVVYAFVTGMQSINNNVTRVFYTVDAIMTYQKFFHFGQCLVERDMQFQERRDDVEGIPVWGNYNHEPEPLMSQDSDYIFQNYTSTQGDFSAFSLGAYNRCFVTSDVDLTTADAIQPNSAYQGLPSFQPTKSSKVGEVDLGIGGYYIYDRINAVFAALGSYNAFEHILNTYVVPEKLCQVEPQALPAFVENFDDGIQDQYNGQTIILKTPASYHDLAEVNEQPTADGFRPVNLKTNFAPYVYFSISDKQGSSVEIPLDYLRIGGGETKDTPFALNIQMFLTAAPNVASILYVANMPAGNGSLYVPLTTMWQQNSYVMTPNNSGYNIAASQAIATDKAMVTNVKVLGTLAVGLLLAAVLTPVGAGLLFAGAASLGTAAMGQFTSGMSQQTQQRQEAARLEAIGLPKANGGLAQGMTKFTYNNAGYKFYLVHLRTDLLKNVDYFFSIFGYTQNKVRYPHINIRRRWCFVKCSNVNIVPNLSVNNYNAGGVPMEALQQIDQRMKNGITFWNIRQALMGDGDTGASDAFNWDDSRIQACINCRFVKNYGSAPDSDVVKENASFTGGYADDYTDDYSYQEGTIGE